MEERKKRNYLTKGQEIDVKDLMHENAPRGKLRMSDENFAKHVEDKLGIKVSTPTISRIRNDESIRSKRKKNGEGKVAKKQQKWNGGEIGKFEQKQVELLEKIYYLLENRFTKKSRVVITEQPK